MSFENIFRVKRIKADNVFALKQFCDELGYYINYAFNQGYRNIVFVCIGTDRLTGDSLGPLTGYKINGMKYSRVFVHGSLDKPIHARNLYDELQYILNLYEKPYIIVVDACLGEERQIGDIIIGEGPLKPGTGVSKNLKPVGNAYIMGVVNISGWMEFQMLQNTRLNTVMRIADVISNGIKYTLWKINYDNLRFESYLN